MAERQPDPLLLSLPDRALTAVVLYGEARGEPIEGQAGVLNVFRNRLASGRFGPTYSRILLQWAQFSCVWPTLAGAEAFKALSDFALHLAGGGEGRTDTERQLLALTDMMRGKALLDNTRGALWYYALTPQLVQAPPRWTAGKIQSAVLGKQVFWKEPA